MQTKAYLWFKKTKQDTFYICFHLHSLRGLLEAGALEL